MKNAWESTKLWLLQNPDKRAGIATPEGVFTVTFSPKPLPLDDNGTPLAFQWVWDRFVKDRE